MPTPTPQEIQDMTPKAPVFRNQAELEDELARLERVLHRDPSRTLGKRKHFKLMTKYYQAHAVLYALRKQPGTQYSDCLPATLAEANAHAQTQVLKYKKRILVAAQVALTRGAPAARGAPASGGAAAPP